MQSEAIDTQVTPSHSLWENKSYELTSIEQVPLKEKWALTPLYALSVHGKMNYWQVGFDPSTTCLYMSHGYVDGVITTDRRLVVVNNSGRNLQEQALLEARQRYAKKFRLGHRPAAMSAATNVKPMLATDWGKVKKLTYPVMVQAKFDGIRCLGRSDRNPNSPYEVSLVSRTSKEFAFLEHVRKDLQNFYVYLPGGAVLDGELYNHNIKAEERKGAVMASKNRHPLNVTMKYHIFDIITDENPPYEKRYELLVKAYCRYIENLQLEAVDKLTPILYEHSNLPMVIVDIIATYGIEIPELNFTLVASTVAYSESEVKALHNIHAGAGYEGAIIRKVAGPNPTPISIEEARYQQKRGKAIIKMKSFFDEEATVIGLEAAQGNQQDAAVFQLQDKNGVVFKATPAETIETRRAWFSNPELVKGKQVTFRYQERSAYNVPLFPRVISVIERSAYE